MLEDSKFSGPDWSGSVGTSKQEEVEHLPEAPMFMVGAGAVVMVGAK